MAYTTIDKSSLHFNTKLYTGNGSAGNAQTGIGFQPDLTWIKCRSQGHEHYVFDVVRGVTKFLKTNTDSAEGTASGVTAWGADGFTLGASDGMNENTDTFVAWNWKAGNSAGSSNTDGSINTTTTSVNTTAGFSISKYTGTGANATVGHGLGKVPKVILFKKTNGADNWFNYHEAIGNTKRLLLSTDAVEATSAGYFNSTTPTSSVFSLGTNGGNNGSGETYMAYCFADIPGFSKFGEYDGNGNANGTFIYTGFKPAWILIKCTNAAEYWHLYDGTRNPSNETNLRLLPNTDSAESTEAGVDLLSNGFKWRNSASNFNGSSKNYVYMAFAAAPLVGSNNVPATAR